MSKTDLIKISLLAQIAMFTWARAIDYIQSHYHYGGSAILGSLIPELLFAAFGIVNLLALVRYFRLVINRRAKLDKSLVFLVFLVLGLVILYVPLTQAIIG